MTDILSHTADGVMTLTLNRVDKKNAFTQDMYGLCAEAMLAAAEDPSVHALVL